MIIIYCLIGFIILMEFATFFVYGWFISKEIEDVYMNLDESKVEINGCYPSILSVKPSFICNHYAVLSKYHISGIGTVPRWSKLHNRIKEYYVIAIKNSQS